MTSRAALGTVIVTMRNVDTGHLERRTLHGDDYAVLYGPELELVETQRHFLTGTITVVLRPKRR